MAVAVCFQNGGPLRTSAYASQKNTLIRAGHVNIGPVKLLHRRGLSPWISTILIFSEDFLQKKPSGRNKLYS